MDDLRLDQSFNCLFFNAIWQDGLTRLFDVVKSDIFTFIVNGSHFESTVAEAVVLSPAVYEILRRDASERTFTISDSGIEVNDMKCILAFIHSKESSQLCEMHQLSLLSLFRSLGNDRLSLNLLRWNCSRLTSDVQSDFDPKIDSRLDHFMIFDNLIDSCASQFYCYSVETLSRLGKGILDNLLSSPSLRIENEDMLLQTLMKLGFEYYEFWKYIQISFLSSDGISQFVDSLPFSELTSDIWLQICDRLKGVLNDDMKVRRFVGRSTKSIESTILNEIPNVLQEFKDRKWQLLYRGTRDGFGSSAFHSKCDNIAKTVTVILTTSGFIFGGFTPIAWDSSNAYKADQSGTSFLFSVTNPGHIDAGKLALKDSRYAIHCNSGYGPTFGNGHDIYVHSDSNTNTSSYTRLGYGYTNNTGVGEYQFFTGSQNFTTKEIEVFALTD